MSKIFYLMGKSSSGKDTIYRRLLEDAPVQLTTAVPYTTRPIREGEQNGRDYFFVTEEELERLRTEGNVIEDRVYQTVHGPWHYFTVKDEYLNPERGDILLIGTLESYVGIRAYFGEETVCPIYVEVEDGVRLQRALDREKKEQSPRYAEMCRRFLSDTQDFSEEKILACGIRRRFENDDLNRCLEEIRAYIKEECSR